MSDPATVEEIPAPASRVCLVIVFNHRYDGNLPTLDRLFAGRFDAVRYLMPFYEGTRTDVFPVFYSSFQFQGFFMEAWRRLRDGNFTHFVFCADDLVINPRLTAWNICEHLGLGPGDGYIKDLTAASDVPLHWHHLVRGLLAVSNINGVNWQKELPAPADARSNLEAKGFHFRRFGWHTVRGGIDSVTRIPQVLYYLWTRMRARRHEPGFHLLGLPYPLLVGYSDLVVVPAAVMENFCRLCSVFAAMGVFVEMALPTALALSCPRVVRQRDTSWKSIDGFEDGSQLAVLEKMGRDCDYHLPRLLERMDADDLYLHPIKFSQWKY